MKVSQSSRASLYVDCARERSAGAEAHIQKRRGLLDVIKDEPQVRVGLKGRLIETGDQATQGNDEQERKGQTEWEMPEEQRREQKTNKERKAGGKSTKWVE